MSSGSAAKDHTFTIRSKTIGMKPPVSIGGHKTQRTPVTRDEENESQVSMETFLRRSAYRHATIKTGEAFFDDSDMLSDYYLVLIYDEISNTPLLSCR
jgi:hypothetical protein